MESNVKYWIPIFNILENFFHVIITLPKYVRTFLGKKTDKLQIEYGAIKKCHDPKHAIIAIAKMLLTCAYHMLFKNESFNIELYKQLTESNFKNKYTKLNINNAIKCLEAQGYPIKQA